MVGIAIDIEVPDGEMYTLRKNLHWFLREIVVNKKTKFNKM